MEFASDNHAGISSRVLDAIAREATRHGGAYGEDDVTERVETMFADVFEHSIRAFPVTTGTSANSLALSCLCEPWGSFACGSAAHVLRDESGAPEFFGNGMRPVPISSPGGRIDASALSAALAAVAPDVDDVHRTPFHALSLTNLTETGSVVSAALTTELSGIAKQHGLGVHLDGARFANAVIATGSSPADLTWRSGVDVMSFGGSKNGAMSVEVVVFFDEAAAVNFERRRKRAGHLVSKQRFAAVQIEALLTDDHWLDNARKANESAAQLAEGLSEIEGVDLVDDFQGNMLFIEIDKATADEWREEGAIFYVDGHGPRQVARLVTSCSTTPTHISTFLEMARATTSTPIGGQRS
jgi:threonine aldolase